MRSAVLVAITVCLAAMVVKEAFGDGGRVADVTYLGGDDISITADLVSHLGALRSAHEPPKWCG